MKTVTKLWIALGALVVLSPVGLILPERFKSGSAWGEWGADELERLVGYVPVGLKRLSEAWNAPMPDYALKGWQEKGLAHLSLAYVLSAVAGVVLIVVVVWVLGKILVKKGE
jgi:hypothetical protein